MQIQSSHVTNLTSPPPPPSSSATAAPSSSPKTSTALVEHTTHPRNPQRAAHEIRARRRPRTARLQDVDIQRHCRVQDAHASPTKQHGKTQRRRHVRSGLDRPAPADDAHDEQGEVVRHQTQARVLDDEGVAGALLDAVVLPVEHFAGHGAADDHACACGQVAQSEYGLGEVRVDLGERGGDGRRDCVVDGVDDAGEGQQDDDVGVGEENEWVHGVLWLSTGLGVGALLSGFAADDGDDGAGVSGYRDAAVARDGAEGFGEEEGDEDQACSDHDDDAPED
ncbi:hypothetical protein OPT61_g4134 [Boeremia exigua]|uniref:Uncharacterized protein n=1 Tax=Boeremia exigua TaxID=749465 RepID=A0ACC2IFC3_9PLEO|nr:hypothetical protein OPT61_g4134 [Boeremia exigua]